MTRRHDRRRRPQRPDVVDTMSLEGSRLDEILLRGDAVEMVRLDVAWSKKGPMVRYAGPFRRDLPFIAALIRSAVRLVGEGLADAAPLFATTAAIAPGGRFDLFSIHYFAWIEDDGTAMWRTMIGITVLMTAILQGRVYETAGLICSSTLRPVIDGADAYAEALQAGMASA